MNKKYKSYKDLLIWQKSFDLSKEIYQITSLFPKAEQFGLVSQLRRAAVSIVSNIAEGFSRRTSKEKIQFVIIAFGSSSETETQLLLAKELSFLEVDRFQKAEELLCEVRSILNSYILRVQKESLILNPKS